MALKIVDFFEDAGPLGVVAGIGAVLLAPVVLPIASGIGKPIAKSVIKSGMMLYEKSRGAIAEAGETWEDIVAEARAELAEQDMGSKITYIDESTTETAPEPS